jgi:hypothetical protein
MNDSKKVVIIEEMHELGQDFWRVDSDSIPYPQDFKNEDEARDFYNSLIAEVA